MHTDGAIKSQEFLGMQAIIHSQAMRETMGLVERAARINAAVLITGESGSGKELIARAIHHYSLRCTKPWVDISCGALPEHLMESELFGFEKGAFSGAETTKPGLFELAHAGTLFLDEVGELDAKMQVKLLRVLDGTPYYRLGGLRKVVVDVRIVAATNQNLEEAMEAGRFRRDLFHRLSQIEIEAPPLRERREAIPHLAQSFLQQHNPKLKFSREALEALCGYSWPGNVRELKNVVIKAAAFAEEAVLRVADLPEALRRLPAGNLSLPALPSTASSFRLETMEQRMILEALNRTGGHCQQAASLLGISRRTLTRKMQYYRLQESRELSGEVGASA